MRGGFGGSQIGFELFVMQGSPWHNRFWGFCCQGNWRLLYGRKASEAQLEVNIHGKGNHSHRNNFLHWVAFLHGWLQKVDPWTWEKAQLFQSEGTSQETFQGHVPVDLRVISQEVFLTGSAGYHLGGPSWTLDNWWEAMGFLPCLETNVCIWA